MEKPANETDEEIKAQLKEILRHVRRFTPKGGIDHESIVQDIWLEARYKGIPAYVRLIKHRCYDAIRKNKTRVSSEEAHDSNGLNTGGPVPDAHLEVDELVRRSSLTGIEKQFIYRYFYRAERIEDIAKLMGRSVGEVRKIKTELIAKLQRTARFLERKSND